MNSSDIAISVQNVTQRFRVIHERPDSLRELFTRFFRTNAEYHDFEAVSNVSLNVHRGEMLGILGRNGSGKSTLLKIIAGVYKPSAGRVEVNGSIAPLIELGAGMHSELTGRENILLNGLLMGFTKTQMLEREQRIIDFSEIGDFVDVPMKQYSSGMYMRLAFSVATEVDPDVLILDEILAVGDIGFQEKCAERLRNFRAAGKTILLVSHSLQQIVDFCDRAVLMDNGRMVLDGRPEEVANVFQAATLPSAHELVEAGS